MKSFRQNRKGVVVTFIVIISFVFVVGLLAFFLSSVVQAIASPTTAIANSFHNSSWAFYDILNLAETFMTNFWTYILVLAILGLALWVYIDSQLKGRQI